MTEVEMGDESDMDRIIYMDEDEANEADRRRKILNLRQQADILYGGSGVLLEDEEDCEGDPIS